MVERVKVLWLIQSNPVDDFNAIAFVPKGPEQSRVHIQKEFISDFNHFLWERDKQRWAKGPIDRYSDTDSIFRLYRTIQSVDVKFRFLNRPIVSVRFEFRFFNRPILFLGLKFRFLYRPIVSVCFEFRYFNRPILFLGLKFRFLYRPIVSVRFEFRFFNRPILFLG